MLHKLIRRMGKIFIIRIFSLVIVVHFSMNVCSQQQSNTAAYNADLHFSHTYELTNAKYHFSGKTQSDFKNWQTNFLTDLRNVLGLSVMEKQLAGYQIKAEMKESIDKETYTLQKWFLWTEPDVPLPFIVLIPKNAKGKLPMVIITHGHGRDSILYDGIYPRALSSVSEANSETLAMQAVKEGYIAIAPTIRGFGSTRFEADIKEGNSFSCHTQLMRDLLTGRTVIGDRVWDISKILDWSIQHFPVDTRKIAITGNSGGGTVSLFAAACDKRITVAVPSSYFCTFTGSIGSIAHCDCNYIPGILGLGEMSDIAGLIAPRPFRALHGIKDEIYPIVETRKAFSHLQTIYAAAGAKANADLYEGQAGHQYYKEGAWPFIKMQFDNAGK